MEPWKRRGAALSVGWLVARLLIHLQDIDNNEMHLRTREREKERDVLILLLQVNNHILWCRTWCIHVTSDPLQYQSILPNDFSAR